MVKLLFRFVVFFLLLPLNSYAQNEPNERAEILKLYQQGNYKDAYEGFRKILLNSESNYPDIASDFQSAATCLNNLSRENEFDQFVSDIATKKENNWRVLRATANLFQQTNHYGYIVANKFSRGNNRGGDGKYVSAVARDRISSIKFLLKALTIIPSSEEYDHDRAQIHFELADAIMVAQETWKLQSLSDLETLPDYEEYHYYYGTQTQLAPVDAQGNPIFYEIPDSFEAAKSDGERWRWALSQAARIGQAYEVEAKIRFANFLQDQFDVHTLSSGSYFPLRSDDSSEEDSASTERTKTYELSNLKENETLARLANGIKRFILPDQFNFIKIYQDLLSFEARLDALRKLGEIFENRKQYSRAVEYWQQAYKLSQYSGDQSHIDQILGAWGQFETIRPQTANKTATFDFRFRNASSLHLTAHQIKTDLLVSDIFDYLKSNPRTLDWNRTNIQQIGYRLVQQEETKYIGTKVGDWEEKLSPRENHFDRRVTLKAPFSKAGAYLLSATVAGGNTSKIVFWLDDTVLIKKTLDKRHLYYVANAQNGKPAPNTTIKFFGYKVNYHQNNVIFGRTQDIETAEFTVKTDQNGQALVDPQNIPTNFQWFTIAETPDHGLAYLGFSGIWSGNYYDYEYNQTKTYYITDRPVYRPGQTVKYKVWVRNAKYDQENSSSYAHQNFTLNINNPRSEKVLEKSFESDDYGGFDGEFVLPMDATLGIYSLNLLQVGGISGTFRVEEYKKPEFEVKIEAPIEPVMLGEKIKAKILARYYFGAAVTKAKVKFKITRTSYSSNWYPYGTWDWFYGPGYWWFAYDYNWYPGWLSWGCKRPIAWWWGNTPETPELIQEQEVAIGEDGSVEVEIDSAIARELRGDSDHRYEISAEVTDESRRTINSTGQVLVARKPYKVYAWLDKGYYRSADIIRASFSAQRLDSKAVKGKGDLKLLKVSYSADSKATEEIVQTWKLDTNDEGRAEIQIKAAQAGQYRLSYTLNDSARHTIEGGYLFTVIGDNFKSAEYRYNELELISDKREYKPGEKVRLMINTNLPKSTVLLFVRPSNGIYVVPELIYMDGKSSVYEIEVTKKDMPNFFVEALTIYDGKVYTETREIIVPPEERVLNIETLASKDIYKPGEEVSVKIKVTDAQKVPYQGSLTLSVYDKAVEYISGGSNVPEIKEFFWKWRRSHRPSTISSLDQYFYNLTKQGVTLMQNLGVFGAEVADQESDQRNKREEVKERADGGGGRMLAKKSMALAGSAVGDVAAAPQVAEELSDLKQDLDKVENSVGFPTAEAQIRKEFADTAFWKAAFETNSKGEAEVNFKMPENLSSWKIRTWAMGHGTKVGENTKEVVTSKNLLIRLQSPRFFVETDEVVLSGNIHNYLKNKALVQAKIEFEGESLELLSANGEAQQTIEIEPNAEARIDWRVKVTKEGTAKIRMFALSNEESDAVEMSFPVYVHGMLKTESFSGALKPKDSSGTINFNVPEDRRAEASRLELRYSPTLAGAMVDALPYLVNYPYGCTEQTLSRFLPTVITQKILKDLKLNLADIREKRSNLNSQEIGSDTKRASQWKHYDDNPVFDEEEVARMVQAGLARLYAMQVSDGGWGWFSGYGEESYAHTTAYVVHGLQIASQNGLEIDSSILARGISWLEHYQAEELQKLKNSANTITPYKSHADDLDALVYMVLIDSDRSNQEMMDFLFRDKNTLAVYSKAMFGLALQKQIQTEKLSAILKNISQYVIEDNENQTAYLNLGSQNYWWYWYGSEFEAQSYYIKLLAKSDTKSELTPKLVKYLLNNRKNATYWNSTRDTTVAIEALADYMQLSGEDKPDLTLEVILDGKKLKEVKINSENLFSFDNKLVLEGIEITSGAHKLELRKKGNGPLYFNAYLTYFSLEDYIKKAGLEIKVNRKYYRLTESNEKTLSQGSNGQALEQNSQKYLREEVADLSVLKSGELVEVELEIDSKNDYEYLIFEDMKPAGFEPVEARSGYNGNYLRAYVEYRDERVSFFTRTLARGKHSVAYRMRAEIPGKFSALPARGYAMYAPELRTNSDEIKLNIIDKVI